MSELFKTRIDPVQFSCLRTALPESHPPHHASAGFVVDVENLDNLEKETP